MTLLFGTALCEHDTQDGELCTITIALTKARLAIGSDSYRPLPGSMLGEQAESENYRRVAGGIDIVGPAPDGTLDGDPIGGRPLATIAATHAGDEPFAVKVSAPRRSFVVLDAETAEPPSDNKSVILNEFIYKRCNKDEAGRAVLATATMKRRARRIRSDGMSLSRNDLGTIVAVLDAPTDSFVILAKLAGLDPARDFRGANLRGVNFGADNLTGFDFSGADLTGTDLSRATGLDCIGFDAATCWPDGFRRPPPDFDRNEARRMILAGQAPPSGWRLFITELNFSGTRISNVEPASGLTALEHLVLWGTQVSDVSPLSELTALRNLDLSGTPVRDILPLSGLTSLLHLDLQKTKISDISPLSGLIALKGLNLWGTRVSDVLALRGLTALQSLDLRGTGVTDVSPLCGLAALQHLDLRDTAVTDVSALVGLGVQIVWDGPRRKPVRRVD